MEDGEGKRYLPQHPLPNEIKEMGRDNTVCQFCGVSYLIHNEIKNLQKELDDCKKEVERLRHYDEREKALIDQVNSLNSKLKDLVEKRHLEEKKSIEYEDLILQKNVAISQLKSNFEKCKEELESEKKFCNNLREQIDGVKVIAAKVVVSHKELRGEFSKTYSMCQNGIREFVDQLNEQKASLLEQVSQLCNMSNISQEKGIQLKIEIDRQAQIYEKKLQDADVLHENQKTVLGRTLKSVKDYNAKILFCIHRFNEFDKNQSSLLQKHQKKISHLNKKVSKLRICLKSFIGEKGSSEAIGKYKQDNMVLVEEKARIVNAHQHQIKQLHESFKLKLLEAEDRSGKLDEEIQALLSKFDDEKRLLLEAHTEALNKATTESNLKYKQLSDCYEKSKRETKKLDDKLKLQQKKFTEEKTQLLKEVTVSYENAAAKTEARYNQMNDEKTLHLATIKKLEQHLESMQVKFHGEMLKQVEQHEKDKRNMEYHISELSKQLEDKHDAKHNEGKGELTQTIEDLKSSLDNAKCVIREKSSCIVEYENELSYLRDCIRRECEERYELTEALAEARLELLSQKRFGDKNVTKQSLSHTLVHNNQTSPSRKSVEKSKSQDKLVTMKELSPSPMNSDQVKNGLVSLSSSRKSRSIKSLNNSANAESSVSRFSKNKLRISLKNK